MCYRCFKAACTCVCDLVSRVDNQTPVTILQHPRERNHPIGTVRFARLGLSRVEVMVHWPHHGPAPVVAALPPGTALLYPEGEGAILPPDAKPDHLLVLDGTWHHARKLFQAHPSLATMPRFALPGEHRSRYRIRREPAEHCLSTIEAITIALKTIEPHTPGFDDLLGAFDRMIAVQEAYIGRRVPRKKKRYEHVNPRPA